MCFHADAIARRRGHCGCEHGWAFISLSFSLSLSPSHYPSPVVPPLWLVFFLPLIVVKVHYRSTSESSPRNRLKKYTGASGRTSNIHGGQGLYEKKWKEVRPIHYRVR